MPSFVNESTLEHLVVANGSNVVLDCRSTKCLSMTVTWKGTGLLSRGLKVDVPILTVSTVAPKDSGRYTCEVVYDHTKIHRQFLLDVTGKFVYTFNLLLLLMKTCL